MDTQIRYRCSPERRWQFGQCVGYRTFHGFALLRRRTKRTLKHKCKGVGEELTDHDKGMIASYHGILMWCDGFRLGRATIGILT